MAEERPWKPTPRCCWCQGRYSYDEVDGRCFFLCKSPECRERQLAKRMTDENGLTFYVPIPRLVSLREAIDSRQFTHLCIGGDRAGGKSHGLRRIAQDLCRTYEEFSVLFLRRTFPELLRNHMKFCIREAKRLGSSYAKPMMRWPNGSEIEFGHCNTTDDFKSYIGAEVDLLIFDQIEQFTDQQVTEISASVGRIRRTDWKGLVLAGENPGGPLASFIDELFISKTRDRVKYPKYDPEKYGFVNAELDDNPWVDEGYVDFLAGLEPAKRDMYRFGRRDVFPGQFFPSFSATEHVVGL